MSELFDICVNVLEWIGRICGITYKEANIWIFVIIEPIMFMVMLIAIIWQRGRIHELKRRTRDE